MISIIVPIFNEEWILRKNSGYFEGLGKRAELIFVDGNSTDRSANIALGYGKVICSRKNRAAQMNEGAREASGDIFLFLHADTQIGINSLATVQDLVINKGYCGGCFRQVINKKGWMFRWIAWTGNVRARLCKIFYGDQGIFINREIFEEMNGYPESVLAEDVLLTKNLRKMGKVKVLHEPIHASARRWLKQGMMKTFLLNFVITIHLALGLSVDKYASSYKEIR